MKNNSKNTKSQSGRWTLPQHNRFMEAVEKYGKNWIQVQKKVKTRTVEQVRSHAQKVFMSMSKTDVNALFGLEKNLNRDDQNTKRRAYHSRKNKNKSRSLEMDKQLSNSLKIEEEDCISPREKGKIIEKMHSDSAERNEENFEERRKLSNPVVSFQWFMQPNQYPDPRYMYPNCYYYGPNMYDQGISEQKVKKEQEGREN